MAMNGIGLVSITENIDYSTPQGKLFTQMPGSFAEYFSESLATHVRKGQGQRASEGRHLGGIPFGYASCWTSNDGGRVLVCDPEHAGGVHLVEDEGRAVTEMFKRYATGTTTTASLALSLNEQGFRTRNTKSLPGPDGNGSAGPRRFTNASTRGMLHNPFYAGQVRYNGERMPGIHEPVIGLELFETVQATMRKNSGRSSTLSHGKTRSYLLKGLIRCARCGMPLWAQTYKNGNSYYREQRGTRIHGVCPSRGGSISCQIPDEQIGRVISAVELHPDWLNQVLERIALKDEVTRVQDERIRVTERLRRLGRAYVDGLYSVDDYRNQKRTLEKELESLVVPEVDAAAEAGDLLKRLPDLWDGASLDERHELAVRMLDGVYVDLKDARSVVGIKPKPPFREVFRIATAREGSGIRFVSLVETGESRTPRPTEDFLTACSVGRRS